MIFKGVNSYIKKLDNIKKSLAGGIILDKVVIDVHTEMVTRIFDKGQNVAGTTFPYADSTKKKKAKRNDDSPFVNFQDTEELIRDFRVPPVVKGNKATVQVDEDSVFKIDILDGKYSNVFQVSKKETDLMIQRFNEELLYLWSER